MTSRVTFVEGKNSNFCFKWQRRNLLYKLVSSTNLGVDYNRKFPIFYSQKQKFLRDLWGIEIMWKYLTSRFNNR
jgi:hypothetical protein